MLFTSIISSSFLSVVLGSTVSSKICISRQLLIILQCQNEHIKAAQISSSSSRDLTLDFLISQMWPFASLTKRSLNFRHSRLKKGTVEMMAHILWKDTPDCHDGSFVRSCFCATLLIPFPLQYPIQGEISTRDFWQLKSSQKLSNKRAYRIDS